MNQSTQNLIEKCKQGDIMSQKTLYDSYKGRFYALCLRFSSSSEEAQDILIEGFLKVFRSLDSYRGEGEFEGWMYKIFINHAIRYTYKSKTDVLSPKFKKEVEETMGTDTNNAFSTEIYDMLLIYLHRLNSRERTIFNMIAIEEYSFSEAAKELHISKSVAKTYYYRARALLQRWMKEKNITREHNQGLIIK